MEEEVRDKASKMASIDGVEYPLSPDRRALTKQISTLSGSEILNRLLGHENPRKIVRDMPNEVFFWLVKKLSIQLVHKRNGDCERI